MESLTNEELLKILNNYEKEIENLHNELSSKTNISDESLIEDNQNLRSLNKKFELEKAELLERLNTFEADKNIPNQEIVDENVQVNTNTNFS